jgi:hypothetical protein
VPPSQTRWVWLVLVGVLAGFGSGHRATGAAPLPLLAPEPYLSIDRDLPTAVKARLVRVNKDLMERARAAGQLPATPANGCVADGFGSFGAPAPKIQSRILGHHVEVVFNFVRMPESPACRPFELTVAVYSRAKAYKNFVGRYFVRDRRGRVVLDLPWMGKAPYHVLATASTITGRRGSKAEQALRCPGSRSAVRGCLAGYRPSLHAFPMPTPVLPLRGVDLPGLESSLDYALAGEREEPIVYALPRAPHCTSLKECIVTYVDPAFPDTAYRVRYRIAGQQVPGCWLGFRAGGPLDPLPFRDAFTGRLELAACVSWLKP